MIDLFFFTPVIASQLEPYSTAVIADQSLRSQRSSQLQKDIDKLIKKHRISKQDLSFVVQDLSTGYFEYALHSEARRIPASLTKIILAGAVLGAFDADHNFETQLLIKDKVERGILQGPLYLKGLGDPSFVSERMWYLVNELMRRRIDQIQGDIIVDDSLFDAINRDSNRLMPTDRAYDAPIGALSFNWNAANVFLNPGDVSNTPAYVYLDPASTPIKLINRAKTGGKKLSVVVKGLSASQNKIDQITVSGNIPLNHKEKVYYRKITYPALWTGKNLKAFLKQRNINVKGQVKKGKTPSQAQVIASSPGANVAELVRLMMKHSNNFIAEMLTKQLALAKGAKIGNLSDGLQAVYSHIQSLGFSSRDFVIFNAAGLSRQNRFHVRSLVKALQIYHDQFSYSYEFVSSLPISGEDGTLKSRMKNAQLKGKVRAKSGQIDGVVGLAGYIKAKNEDVKVFAIIYNGKKGNYGIIQFIDEAMLSIM